MDVRRLREAAEDVTTQSLESTRRIRLMAMNTRELGAATNEVLHGQGEQLQQIEDELLNQNQKMRQAEKSMTKMEKFCGCFVCPWNMNRSFSMCKRHIEQGGNKTSQYKKAYKKKDNSQPSPDAVPVTAQPDPVVMPQKLKMARILDDAKEDEIERNLDDISDVLDELHMQALTMSGELDTQNRQLAKMEMKIDVNTSRVLKANTRTAQLLLSA